MEKPRYGFVAIKYFLSIGVIGVFGILAVLVSVILGVLQTLWLFIPGICIGFVGTYIAIAYIPLYFGMLRPRKLATLWTDVAAEESLSGTLKVLDVGCGTGGVAIRVAQALPNSKGA